MRFLIKPAFLLIIGAFAALPFESQAKTVLIKSRSDVFSNTLFASFLASSKGEVAVQNYELETELPDYGALRKLKPDLFVTIGNFPVADLANNFKKTYIIAIAHNDAHGLANIENVIPVSIEVPFEQAMPIIKEAFPKRKTIGVLYNPKLTRHVSVRFKESAEASGFNVAAIKVDTPEDVYLALQTLKGKVDLFYLIPDATVFRTPSLNALFSFFVDNNVPYISPTTFYLRKNGVMSLGVDPVATGRQLYRLGEQLVKEGKKKSELQTERSRLEAAFSLEAGKNFGIDAQRARNLFRTLVEKGFKVQVVE